MSERMGIYYLRIKLVLMSKDFELLGNTPWSDTLTKSIKKDIARSDPLFLKPQVTFFTQEFRNL